MLRRWWLSVGCLVASVGSLACRSSDAGLRPPPTNKTGGATGSHSGGSGGRGGAGGTGGRPDAEIDAAPVPEPDGSQPSTIDATQTPPDLAPDLRPIDLAPPPVDMRPLEIWKPAVGMTWDWQLAVPINPTVNVQVFTIDLFDNDATVVSDLHTRGKKVICHVDFGTFEPGRPDAAQFPRESVGTPYKGNPERMWLDIRNMNGLKNIIHGRLNLAASKGCDAIAPDNLDGWDLKAHEATGFSLSPIDQVIYNRTIAAEAHARGLAVALKNDIRQVDDLLRDFDFHLSENCYQRKDCALLTPFITLGKPVFDAEYTTTVTEFCPLAKKDKISAIKKKPELNTYREACP